MTTSWRVISRGAVARLPWLFACACASLVWCAVPAAEATGLHAGPAAWLEEYWDVKPEKFDEFLATYRREIYSIARQIPGYRGYTVLTNIPDPAAPSHPNLFGEKMIIPHYGVHLEGKILTERAVNVGNLLRRTHNVIIVHHLRSWADADAFRGNLARIHDERHPGVSLADDLGKTLYPLANNTFEANFRLITTGLPVDASTGSGGKDADGLDLQPHRSDTAWFKEYFEVEAKELPAFLDAYNETYSVMRDIPGYRGVTIVTTLPPAADEAKRTGYSGQVLGGSPDFYVPHTGVMMDGIVRTDTSINFARLFKDTYTIITYYEVPWNIKLLELMQKNWEAQGNHGDRVKHVTERLFPHVRNHWDMQYRAIETSFVPLALDPTVVASRQGSPLLGSWQADIPRSTFVGRAPYKTGRMTFTAEGAAIHVVADVVTASGAAFHFEYAGPEDDSFVPVSGNPYYDSAATRWVDSTTVLRTERRAGQVTGSTTMALAQDGKSFTAHASRSTPEDGHLYTSDILWKRASDPH